MNLKFLETFLWVARHRNLRVVADQLFSTPAAVAGRVSALEEDLGVKLLLRDSHNVSLTAEGLQVLDYAERMLELDAGLRDALAARHSGAERLRIGVVDIVAQSWLNVFLQRIAQSFTQLHVELTVDTALNLRRQLRDGQLELILQTEPVRMNAVRNCVLSAYPMAWVAAKNVAVPTHISELAESQLLTFGKNSRAHQELLGLLHASGLATPRITCVESLGALIGLIESGFGIAALPAVLVQAQLQRGDLRALALAPTPCALELIASWRQQAGFEHIEQIVELGEEAIRAYLANSTS